MNNKEVELAITDVEMPKRDGVSDGVTLVQNIRKKEADAQMEKAMPFIVVTGLGEVPELSDERNLVQLKKPDDLKVLVEIVRILASRSEMRGTDSGSKLSVVSRKSAIRSQSSLLTPYPLPLTTDLAHLTHPALVLVDAIDLVNHFLNAQEDELIGLAHLNKENKGINIVIYNADAVSYDALQDYRGVGNIIIIREGVSRAFERFGNAFIQKYPERQVIHLSTNGIDPRKEFSTKRIDYYRHVDERAGTLGAALLRNQNDGNLPGVVQGKDGFWRLLSDRVRELIEAQLARLTISRAA